jgi:hydroxyethylthiazole kinase-like uncharacterized protein yjeF
MLSIVTPDEMRDIDAAASAHTPERVYIERAGSAVAWSALRMLGGSYGRRVVVIAGPGNNGADGRVAARKLQARGVHVRVFSVDECPRVLPECDLVIDAAFGTGFHGLWHSPDPGSAQVLAVDIPSGVDGLTGSAGGGVMQADHTVTFASLKPGLLFEPGSGLAGSVEVADIGLSAEHVRTHLVQQVDVADWWQPRDADSHKWTSATRIIAGSAGMTGAAYLASSAAQRSGAGMVQLSIPGAMVSSGEHEYVQRPLPASDWANEVCASLDRFQSLIIGPGLGRDEATVASIRKVVATSPVPTVIDGDGLFALAWSTDGAASALRDREAPTVLTPHDGEFALLAGAKVGPNRIMETRLLAFELGVVVLLKGPATVIADPDGRVLVVTAGDDRLATAGTGDVLSGIVGAALAQGVPAFEAAAAGAWIHGRAGRLGTRRGLIASDLLALIPRVLDSLA